MSTSPVQAKHVNSLCIPKNGRYKGVPTSERMHNWCWFTNNDLHRPKHETCAPTSENRENISVAV